MTKISKTNKPFQQLFNDISEMISEGKNRVAVEVNHAVALLYWSIGKRINDEILKGDRANYGEQIISQISVELTHKFGKGYNKSNLFRMIRFAKLYPDSKIIATVSRQLSWSHIVMICQMNNGLQRDFYLVMARIERWSVRETRDKINSMLFERTAISKRPEKVIKTEINKLRGGDELNPDLVFRDPCFLEFANLSGKYPTNVYFLPTPKHTNGTENVRKKS